MRLGELIGIARECKGWTLRDLERATGLSNAAISQIETGKVKDPSFSAVISLVDALGLSWDRVVRCGRKFNGSGVLRDYVCETCQDNPEVCASIPGLRHCGKALRDAEAQRK